MLLATVKVRRRSWSAPFDRFAYFVFAFRDSQGTFGAVGWSPLRAKIPMADEFAHFPTTGRLGGDAEVLEYFIRNLPPDLEVIGAESHCHDVISPAHLRVLLADSFPMAVVEQG
jgi:hypothetical protein